MKLMIVGGIAAVWLSACSGSGGSKPTDGKAGEAATAEVQKFDIERINTYATKKVYELTCADYDFMLDQMEIIVDRTKEMTREEYEQWLAGLDDDMQASMFVIAMVVSAGEKHGALSDEQLRRSRELEQKSRPER